MERNKTPEEMDVALGAAVRIRRRMMGMSQEMLAEHCDVSFQQIQKYENGTNRISFSRLVQIAQALKCRVSDLVAAVEPSGEASPVGASLVQRLSTPGAMELLEAYERLPAHVRAAVVQFAGNLTRERDAEREAA